jgi:hypothetical protein
LARFGGLFGFGAYVEWLRYASARHGPHGLATAEWYHTRLVGLMRRVFKRGQIQVHGTDVAFFHLKSATSTVKGPSHHGDGRFFGPRLR